VTSISGKDNKKWSFCKNIDFAGGILDQISEKSVLYKRNFQKKECL